MDSFDSCVAHPPEASTDERAFSPPLPEASPPFGATFPEFGPIGCQFETTAEQEAYWLGVRAGAEAARIGIDPPPLPVHRPADFDCELNRNPEAVGLVSARLAETADRPRARAPRHDGWTLDKQRIFLTTLASTGVVADACRACGMSRDAAYSLRNSSSGRPFALAWEAALVLARPALADELASRVRYGVIERIYRNGELVGERHRHDNRLAMAVLTRLDRQVEQLAERAPAVAAVADEFSQFLDSLGGGAEAAEAFIAPRLCGDPIEPPHFRDASHRPGSEASLLARAAFRERHGVGMPSDIAVDDLASARMESWTDDQLRRAEASGFLASLDDSCWPDSALDAEADGTDGMCKLRKLYLRIRPAEDGEE